MTDSASETEQPFDEWLTGAQRRSGYLGWYEKQGAKLHGEQADLWRALREIRRLQAENEQLRAQLAEALSELGSWHNAANEIANTMKRKQG